MFQRKCKLTIDWSQIEASAPGKFVLIGDYGDLYERNVIAVAIDKRLKVTIRPHNDKGMLKLNLKDFNDIREWPTRLPTFSMTKLVANYADTLTFSETTLQNLKPLLNEKYYQSKSSSSQVNQQSSQEQRNQKHASTAIAQAASENNAQNASLTTPNSTVFSSLHSSDSRLGESGGKAASGKKDKAEGLSCYEHKDSGKRSTSTQEQADMAVISFLLLYIALGDSFASSNRPSLDIEVESQIPMCRGLGSSTAYAVAMCTALMKVYRVSAEPTIIMDWTQSIDRYFHGEASALHSCAAVNGGYVYFQHGKLRSCGIPHQSPLKIMLIDTGLRRDPKLINSILVEKLAQKLDTVNTMLNTLNELVSQTWRRMNDPDFIPPTIDAPLKIAQDTLDLMGLGHRNVLDICTLAQQSHLAVKQSQAGETVFLLYDSFECGSNLTEFRNNLKDSAFEFHDHSICFEGFKVKATSLTGEKPFPQLSGHL